MVRHSHTFFRKMKYYPHVRRLQREFCVLTWESNYIYLADYSSIILFKIFFYL